MVHALVLDEEVQYLGRLWEVKEQLIESSFAKDEGGLFRPGLVFCKHHRR